MERDAIILDTRYSKGLIGQAIRNGYASPIQPPEDDIDREIITGYLKSRLSHKALEYLLLYPTAYLYHCHDYINLSRLKNYMPLISIDPESIRGHELACLRSPEGHQTAKLLKPILLPALRNLSRDEPVAYFRINKKTYDVYIDSISRGGKNGPMDSILDMTTHPNVLRLIANGIGVDIRALNDRLENDKDYSNIFGAEAALRLLPHMSTINSILVDTVGLLKASESLGVAAAISWNTPRSLSIGEKSTRTVVSGEEAYRCFYIFLEEVDAFPVVRTIDDVLRLREDKRIENWRQSLHAWAVEIKDGRAEAERKMRRAIKSAMKDLKRLGPVRNISAFVTALSLPIGIAESMHGIIGPGFALSTVSAGIEIYSRATSWKHRWILFGRSIK